MSKFRIAVVEYSKGRILSANAVDALELKDYRNYCQSLLTVVIIAGATITRIIRDMIGWS